MSHENMVPAAVRAQVDAAEKAAMEAQGTPAPVEDPNQVAPVEPTEPVAEPEPVQADATVDPQVDTESQPEPVAEPEPQVSDATAELERTQAELARLKQAHKVLVGKYSAEVPRGAREIRELKALVAKLEAEKDEPSVDPDNPYGFTDDEKDVAEEAGSMAQKIARAEAQKLVKEEIAKLAANGKESSNDEDPFTATLSGLVPDWESINTDPQFIQWLDTKQSGLGVPPRVALDAASSQGDAITVAQMFTAWKDSQVPATPPVKAKPSVASQVAPKTVTNKVVTNEKPTYSLAQIEQLTTDVARGKYSAERQKQLLQEIDQAVRDGRIRQD